MMIDGIKVIVKLNLDEIRNHPKLTFKKAEVTSTGEIVEIKYPKAAYKGLIFTDRISHIEIAGSLHKFVNDGLHNHNDFNVEQIQRVIYQLCREIGVTACLTQILNLEFGVNIKLNDDPNFILRSIIMHRGEIFSFQKSTNKEYRECEHTQYYVKVYNKGLQYGLTDFVIRIEVKYRKMEQLNKLGIKNLSDVMNPKKLEKLANLLLSVYDDIIIGDCSIIPEGLKAEDKLMFANGHNPEWWKTIKPVSKSFDGKTMNKKFRSEDKQYYRELNRFTELLKQIGATNRKNELRKLMEDKINHCLKLTGSPSNSCLKLTNPDITKMSEIDQPFVEEPIQSESCEMSEIDTLLYPDNLIQEKKKCIVMGLDISMQKEDSKFLCTSGVKFYKENHPEIWLRLWQRLDSKWHGCSEEIQIDEIHHSIRNEYFNAIHNTRRSLDKVLAEPALFDQFNLIRPDKLKIAGYDRFHCKQQ